MNDDQIDRRLEISALYIDVMQALDGASLPAARSALAMAVLMIGENSGLDGAALLAWIDGAGNEAKAAITRTVARRH